MPENKKPTKRENFGALLTVVNAAEKNDIITPAGATHLRGFIDHEVELLSKKHSATKLTANQVENIRLKAVLVDEVLGTGIEQGMSASDIASAADVGVQKATALLKMLISDGMVLRSENKGKATFSLL